MKILVIGASGRVGKILTGKLLDKNHQVTGTTRQDKKLFTGDNYQQIKLDLTASLTDIKDAMPDNVDAIYFVSGSGGENLLQVDLHGAVKAIKAAEEKGIKRYIMLSTVFATEPALWQEKLPEEMLDYYVAKHYADAWLINNSKLDYTILQPSTLKEESGSGKITVQVEEAGENAIEDVAATLLAVLENPSTSKKVISMHAGDQPIKEAIAAMEE